jgi:hypothetical protein
VSARRHTLLPLAAALFIAGCVGQDDTTESTTSLTVEVSSTTSTPTNTTDATFDPVTAARERQSTSTTTNHEPITSTTSTTQVPGLPLILETNGATTVGVRNEEIVFTVTVGGFTAPTTTDTNGDELANQLGQETTREGMVATDNLPDRILIEYGENDPITIRRLWPLNETADLIWLTDYSGDDSDRWTGEFRLLDTLRLEGRTDIYGLHIGCRNCDTDIGPALVSFEDEPTIIMAWDIDPDTLRFVPVDDLTDIHLNCTLPKPRI